MQIAILANDEEELDSLDKADSVVPAVSKQDLDDFLDEPEPALPAQTSNKTRRTNSKVAGVGAVDDGIPEEENCVFTVEDLTETEGDLTDMLST